MSFDKISEIAQQLWDLNEIRRGVDYKIDLQKTIRENPDHEDLGPLISLVDVKNFNTCEAIRALRAITPDFPPPLEFAAVTAHPEDSNELPDTAEYRFLKVSMKTEMMQLAKKFLVKEGKAPEDENAFIRKLHKIWFTRYYRSNKDKHKTSAFQHIFIGEERVRKQDVLGLHSWISYYHWETEQGRAKYHGYYPSETLYSENDQPGDASIVLFDFTLDGIEKSKNGFLIGTCPEFELALLTIIFYYTKNKPTQHVPVQYANINLQYAVFKKELTKTDLKPEEDEEPEDRSAGDDDHDKWVIATIYPTYQFSRR